MPDTTVYVRVSRTRSRWGRTLRQVIEDVVSTLPEEIRAGGTDIDDMLYKVGIVTAGHIKGAFVTKSQGGTDEAGERWQPLSPKTVAYRRANRTKRERARETWPSQALTKKQQERWWEVYRRGLMMYQRDKSRAAKLAWFVLKSEGATTLFNKYGGAQVDILRDTRKLLNAILPRVEGGEVLVGVDPRDVPYAAAHHYGVPDRGLPQRRLWPEPQDWPQSWWDGILSSIEGGLTEIIARRVREDL